jgi:hypothetical protein
MWLDGYLVDHRQKIGSFVKARSKNSYARRSHPRKAALIGGMHVYAQCRRHQLRATAFGHCVASRQGIDANTARWFGGDLIAVAVSGACRIGCCTSALVGHHRGLGGVERLLLVLSY